MARERNCDKNNYMILNSDENGCGTGFNISRHIMNNLLHSVLVNQRNFKIRIELKYCNMTLQLK
jgi:hypothetical protein